MEDIRQWDKDGFGQWALCFIVNSRRLPNFSPLFFVPSIDKGTKKKIEHYAKATLPKGIASASQCTLPWNI